MVSTLSGGFTGTGGTIDVAGTLSNTRDFSYTGGQLTVTNGGVVSAQDEITLTDTTTSVATGGRVLSLDFVTVSGGTYTTGGQLETPLLTLANAASFQFNAGGVFVNNTVRVTIEGNSTFNLGGTSQTTGAFTLIDGTASNGTLTSSSYDVRAGTVSASLAGAGAVTKSTTGLVTFSATNSYTGGTSVNGGTLRGGANNAFGLGVASVAGSGTLDLGGFNQTVTSLTGTGIVTNNGAAQSILSAGGDNSSFLFEGRIQNGTAPVGLTKNGTGVFSLTATNPFTGPALVNAGTLNVDGSIGSNDVTVANGGTLRGSGTIGTAAASLAVIQSGGTVFPSSALNTQIGTITFTGSLTFEDGSRYLNRITGGLGGSNDLINANQAFLQGGDVALLTAGSVYLPGVNYTILSASGGVSGTFDGVTTASGSALPELIVPSLVYRPTAVLLALQSDFVSAATTDNQRSVARAIDIAGNAGGYGADAVELLTALVQKTRATAPQAFDALSGEGVSGTQQTAFGAGKIFKATVLSQTISPRNTLLTPSYKDQQAISYKDETSLSPDNELVDLPSRRGRLWGAGFGLDATLDGEIGRRRTADLKSDTGGFVAGTDYRVSPAFLVGFAGGGTESSFSVTQRSTSGSVDGSHFGLYGMAEDGPLYVTGVLNYARYSNKTQRIIADVGLPERASGKFSSDEYSGRFEAGWRYSYNTLTVTPFAGIQIAQLEADSFEETSRRFDGSRGILGLSYDATSTTSILSSIGLRFDAKFALDKQTLLTPYTRLAWDHEFRDDRRYTASLLALPSGFNIGGARAAEDVFSVDAGLKLGLGPDIDIFASYNGEFSERSESHGGSGGVKIRW
jgi:outer membrane autotransporter protein